MEYKEKFLKLVMQIRDLRWLFIPIFVTPIIIGWLVGRVDVGIGVWVNMWSDLMLIISTCFLVLVTGLMAYWLYKTFNHTLSVETAKILETNRDRIFKDNKKIIDIIFGNINKTNKDDYMQFQNNNRYELQILLLDLEYIGILYQNKVLKLDILFNMFAGLFIIIQDDAQIKKYIEERRKVSITKSSKPYDGLLKMINDCVNYDNKNKKIDDI